MPDTGQDPILEEALTAAHAIAGLDEERRLESDVVGSQQGQPRAGRRFVDGLGGFAGQGQIQTTLQLMIAQAATPC